MNAEQGPESLVGYMLDRRSCLWPCLDGMGSSAAEHGAVTQGRPGSGLPGYQRTQTTGTGGSKANGASCPQTDNLRPPQYADPSPLVRQGEDIVCAIGNGGATCDVGSSHPGAGVGPKGWAVRPLKRYASWVQNVVRQWMNALSINSAICWKLRVSGGTRSGVSPSS